jgi:phosphomannomutase/phosphoglucomutase
MRVPPEVFREYDVRGIADTDLSDELAGLLGRAVGTTVRRGGGSRVLVGRDARLSGERLAGALADGLQAAGCTAVDAGVIPTPVNYWGIEHLGLDGSVQVTGSHNPPEYNGFKLTLLGRSLHGGAIQAIREMIERNDLDRGNGTRESVALIEPYVEELAGRLQPAARALRVVVDAGNGTGGMTAVPLYERLGYEVVPLYCDPDGSFPNHHADPTVEANLEDLRREVAARHGDVGFAFDGDADRIGIIDRDGEVVWGDRLMILLARALLAESPGATIIGEVKCSKTLYDDIQAHGGHGVMWRTGHSLIKSKMKESGAQLAGEMSGHVFYAHRYYGFDDAAYAGGRLLEILSRETKSITELLGDVPTMASTPEIRFDCPEEIKFDLVAEVTRRFQAGAEAGGYEVIDIDGARVEWPDGWGLVRCSNTQPLLVLRFEAKTEKRLAEIRAAMEDCIEAARLEVSA